MRYYRNTRRFTVVFGVSGKSAWACEPRKTSSPTASVTQPCTRRARAFSDRAVRRRFAESCGHRPPRAVNKTVVGVGKGGLKRKLAVCGPKKSEHESSAEPETKRSVNNLPDRNVWGGEGSVFGSLTPLPSPRIIIRMSILLIVVPKVGHGLRFDQNASENTFGGRLLKYLTLIGSGVILSKRLVYEFIILSRTTCFQNFTSDGSKLKTSL